MSNVALDAVGGLFTEGAKAQAKTQASIDINRYFQGDQKLTAATETLFTIALDVTYDRVVRGDITVPTLNVAIVQGASAIAGFSDDEKTKCIAALVDLGANILSAHYQIGAIAAVEFGTGGLATPAVVGIQIPLLMKTAYDAGAAAFKANQQCGPLVTRGIEKIEADWGNIVQAQAQTRY